ncbi:hypothetical protein Micbo1qcDRAFT_236911 [Microdochium bolleyi]|uniref:Fumarylacetoacetate hydrolase n=1 Tax=Microdochium bolleyi TaxID=196109 RepID=A0A136IN41_9PEZI|nr:hypothetical protein Micbo1qcDRAFT_236911 [Microdochium bolleyi]
MTRPHRFIAFTRPGTKVEQVGHYDHEGHTVQPLSFQSGYPVENLYQVIEAQARGAPIVSSHGTLPIPLSSVSILPPLAGRDVLAVGKNYMEHAKEFNSSGYDSSDKVDRPSHPVIFTKRATSIVAHGHDIYAHDEAFTTTADYEGEIGVIIGKRGFRISQDSAWDHVWGYTIINDITARERQRDHKQFYIGKSADTFCPMGPVAMRKEDLPAVLQIQTHVNGELRQQSSTADLIFSIPELIATLSAGQTLQPGDILATGTPAGVGIGKTPPVFLRPGDEIAISVTGLGTLINKVAQKDSVNPTIKRVDQATAFQLSNNTRERGRQYTMINDKPVSYLRQGPSQDFKRHAVFVHGLGATKELWAPLTSALAWHNTALHLYDFEGHGLTPTHPLSELSVSSLAADLSGVIWSAGITSSSPATLVAHGMGCLVALKFAVENLGLVERLVLLSPPATTIAEGAKKDALARAALVRAEGMPAIANTIISETFPQAQGVHERKTNVLAETVVRVSLLSQDPEGYAKALCALATSDRELGDEDIRLVQCPVLIVAGRDDEGTARHYGELLSNASVEVVDSAGHWVVFEDSASVADAVDRFCGAASSSS